LYFSDSLGKLVTKVTIFFITRNNITKIHANCFESFIITHYQNFQKENSSEYKLTWSEQALIKPLPQVGEQIIAE